MIITAMVAHMYLQILGRKSHINLNSDGYRKIFIDGVDRTLSGGPNKTSTPTVFRQR